MSIIVDVIGREILDSRGNPTVECDVLLESGIRGRAIVPSGTSVGSHEAYELRDCNKNRYNGKGVLTAVQNINTEIARSIKGLNVTKQSVIDYTMINLDNTENKKRLGANAILAVSLAVAKAAAKEVNLPLYRYIGGCNIMQMPVPMINIINGGVHTNNNLNIQEFMIVPVGQNNFREALRCGAEIFYTLRNILNSRKISTNVGDEGGFAPNFVNNDECLTTLLQAIEKSGYIPGKDVLIALDCASSTFYFNGKYHLASENLHLTSEEFVEYLVMLTNTFPIISIEDGMSEHDWNGWKILTNTLKNKVQLVGDDIFTTNTKIFSKGINSNIANSILIKINQIGTLTETFAAVEMAKHFGYTSVISHRSGESEDSTIADIAVALNTLQIKTGSLSRSERVIKYNQLLRIEEELGSTTNYPGLSAFYNIKK